MDWTARGATDIGRIRAGNEDAFLIDESLGLAIVADGMGGHACGEIASDLAVETFRTALAVHYEHVRRFADGADDVEQWEIEQILESAALAACRAVFFEAQSDVSKRGMGTTLTALVMAGDAAFLAHVGDSRAYVVRDGRSIQLTRDHSLLNQLIEQGRLTADEAADPAYNPYRNALSRAIGVSPDVKVDTIRVDVMPGDLFILGSDGLTAYFGPDEYATLARKIEYELAERMVEIANARGGHDNITAVTVGVEGSPIADERAGVFRDVLEALASVTIFDELDYGQLLHLHGATEMRNATAGNEITRAGSAADALFVVMSGTLTSGNPEAPSLQPGDHFGELSLLDGTQTRFTVTADTDCELVVLPREGLREVMARRPDLGLRLLTTVAGVSPQSLTGFADDTSGDLTEPVNCEYLA